MWKSFSRNGRSILGVIAAIGLVLAGCAPKVVVVADRPSESVRKPAEAAQSPPTVPEVERRAGEENTKEADPSTEPDPRTLAALRLTDQAKRSLDARKPDQAIRILERAVNLDPNNGRNFYLLAEAWLMKGVVEQAREFNRLAGMYLSGEEPSWEKKVKRQKERIEASD